MSMLRFEGVDFAYHGASVLAGVDFEVPSGKLTAIMGPSGCGKSTLIALAAGLLVPDRGRVTRESQRLAVAFQVPALLPWKTACSNVGFALRADGVRRTERHERARGALAEVGLAPEAMEKYPRQLSGGMRQRVALARALAVRPDLLLCDEPFSALDGRSRQALRQLLLDIRARAGLATVFVTHDSEEALALADVLVVMAMGRIDQVGTPGEILARPASAAVTAQIAG